MAPPTGTALLLLAVFVLPGFVTLVLRERSYAVKGEESPFERLLNALFYSALIYALTLSIAWMGGLGKDDLTEFYSGKKTLGEDILAATIIGVLMPAVIAEAGLLWRGTKRLRPRVLKVLRVSPAHSVQSGWNDLFAREGTMLLRVTLDDGRVVGGFYGSGSFAGYSEHRQDLLISQRWEFDADGWFFKPAEDSVALWLSAGSVVSIEAYDPADAPSAESVQDSSEPT